jgi:hypothetical protein
MPKVTAFSNLNAASAAHTALADMVGGAVGIAFGPLAVEPAALVAYPIGIWLAGR